MKNYGDIDSKFRYVILSALRAKQLLGGAKPRVRSKSKNLIRIAQEEVKQGLVEFQVVKSVKERIDESSDSSEEMFIGEDLALNLKDEPEENAPKKKKTGTGKKS